MNKNDGNRNNDNEFSYSLFTTYPIHDPVWREEMKCEFSKTGILKLSNFLTQSALDILRIEASEGLCQAFFDPRYHNIYLAGNDSNFSPDHIRNKLLLSSKGCITDDQILATSPLKCLYKNDTFVSALAHILNEESLYEYADSLSSINIHYARQGEGLNWHFDNSSFAVTLMISPAMEGGDFQYVRDVRNSAADDMGYDSSSRIVDGSRNSLIITVPLLAGDLLLFRGKDSLHRVTPVVDSDSVRQLATLAFNNSPGVALSEEARLTFFGRLGEVRK